MVNGVSAGSVTVEGTSYTITGLTTYAGDDQKVYYPASSTTSYVDFPGLSVETSGGFALNHSPSMRPVTACCCRIRTPAGIPSRSLLRGHRYR